MRLTIATPIYVLAAIAANLSAFHFGMWATPINSILFVGLDMALRDRMHDAHGPMKASVVVFSAALVSVAVAPGSMTIALASSVSFVAAGLASAVAFQLAIRHKWMVRSNAGNIAHAATDSLVFPLLAFGGFYPAIVVAQFAAKVIGGLVWSVILRKRK